MFSFVLEIVLGALFAQNDAVILQNLHILGEIFVFFASFDSLKSLLGEFLKISTARILVLPPAPLKYGQ